MDASNILRWALEGIVAGALALLIWQARRVVERLDELARLTHDVLRRVDVADVHARERAEDVARLEQRTADLERRATRLEAARSR